VGIVGGSIAGCLMALELVRAGHRVTVFERSPGEMEGLLGAGLGTPTPMFRTLLERGLIDSALPHLALEDMAFVGRAEGGERHGHVALTLPLIFIAFHWGDLHRGLRSRVPDDAYLAGHPVAGVVSLGDGAIVHLEDRSEHRFDFVVGADGYESRVRASLFPGAEPEYRGYVCWRGVLHEEEMDAAERERMASTFARFGSGGMSGSFLYPLPGSDGSTARGERLINWGCYLPVAAEKLSDFLVDREGHHHDGTIPPGRMRPEEERRLKMLARESLPPYYADVIDSTPDTFAQAVLSVEVPDYHVGRVCLTGDAGTVAPPFTGSGIFKAATNAINLTAALATHDDVDMALAAWGAAEAEMAARILDVGRQFDDAFIRANPDFGAMDRATAARWWRRSVTNPDGFTFEADAG
jgi:2-polyprenyl-6-methoxyphenol hydroxylase-like FAD-dependent oxidoreductase